MWTFITSLVKGGVFSIKVNININESISDNISVTIVSIKLMFRSLITYTKYCDIRLSRT